MPHLFQLGQTFVSMAVRTRAVVSVPTLAHSAAMLPALSRPGLSRVVAILVALSVPIPGRSVEILVLSRWHPSPVVRIPAALSVATRARSAAIPAGLALSIPSHLIATPFEPVFRGAPPRFDRALISFPAQRCAVEIGDYLCPRLAGGWKVLI